MSKNTSACGKREEREVVKELKARGYDAHRVPGSGNVDPTLPSDVEWTDSPIGKLLIECKWRTSCGWRTLLKWMEGAPILTVKCGAGQNQHVTTVNADSDRYVFMKWDTFMALVGSAADRSEHAHELPRAGCPECHKYAGHCPVCHNELPEVVPDKPWINEVEHFHAHGWPTGTQATRIEQQRREAIQAAHKNPPQRKPERNKLKGRGFGK